MIGTPHELACLNSCFYHSSIATCTSDYIQIAIFQPVV